MSVSEAQRPPLTHAERGKLGATARWGEFGRVLRLDRLPEHTRSEIERVLREDRAGHEAQS